jgi:flagellar protein FlaJ
MKYLFEIGMAILGVIILIFNYLVVPEFLPFLIPVLNVVAAVVIGFPPVMLFYGSYRKKREIENQFIAFLRDLTDSIDSGMTLPMALEHCSKRDYLALSPYVKSLVAQVNWGIPFRKALETFAKSTKSKLVNRAIATITETYRVGGKISDTLNSVSKSMVTIQKINAERRAAVYSQIMTSYLIFFVFIFIMVIIQVMILPTLTPSEISEVTLIENVTPITPEEYQTIFTVFIVLQGFFAGIATGKMSEGSLTAGFKHSLILVIVGYAIFSLATMLPSIRIAVA